MTISAGSEPEATAPVRGFITARFVAVTVLPVIATQLCLAPFWFSHTYSAPGGTWLPIAGVLLSGLLIPIYLAVIGCRLLLQRVSVGLLFGFSTIAATLVLNVFLDYAFWGISTGYFWKPDAETVLIIQIIAGVSLVVSFFPPLITLGIRNGFWNSPR